MTGTDGGERNTSAGQTIQMRNGDVRVTEGTQGIPPKLVAKDHQQVGPGLGHAMLPTARHRAESATSARLNLINPEPGCGSGSGYQFMASAMARSNASNGNPP